MNETVPVMENNKHLVTTFISNGMQYTITAQPLPAVDMISLRTYLGYKPAKELAENVAKTARTMGQPYITEFVSTQNYNGYILKYSKEYLDEYFKLENRIEINNDTDDDLPF